MSSDGVSYYITRRVANQTHHYPIAKERFEQLKVAWENLKHIAHFEEEWDAVVQNYVELEKALIETALKDMLTSGLDYFQFQEIRLRFGVHLSNLLSSCKAYLDHTSHHLGQLSPSADYQDQFKALASAEYDRRFGYRFMEELRRYSQHRGLPIHGARYDSSWVEGGDEGMLRFSVSARVNLDILRADGKFKAKILAEIEGSDVQAEFQVRDYLEGLSAVHVGMRNALDELFKSAKALVGEAIADFESASPKEGNVGLYAVELREPKAWTQQVPLFGDLAEMVERLRLRNRPMVNLKRRFVTSAVSPKPSAKARKNVS